MPAAVRDATPKVKAVRKNLLLERPAIRPRLVFAKRALTMLSVE